MTPMGNSNTKRSDHTVVPSDDNSFTIHGASQRESLVVHNDCDKNLYLGLGITPTSSSFSILVAPGAMVTIDGYRGSVNGICDSGPVGDIMVTALYAG